MSVALSAMWLRSLFDLASVRFSAGPVIGNDILIYTIDCQIVNNFLKSLAF